MFVTTCRPILIFYIKFQQTPYKQCIFRNEDRVRWIAPRLLSRELVCSQLEIKHGYPDFTFLSSFKCAGITFYVRHDRFLPNPSQ